jgi:hypothetical protein
MGVRKTLVAALIGTGAALASAPALAAHIPGFGFAATDFTFDPTAYCDEPGCTEFTAKFIDFSYQAEVDQTGIPATTTGTFSETGFAFFSTFQTELGSPVNAGTSGLNLDYQMYALFFGGGNVAVNGIGGVDGVFNDFTAFVVIDPLLDTACTVGALGGAGGNESVSCSGQTDDVVILIGTLDQGGFHVFPGLAAGDFDVLLNVVSFDGTIWGGDAFAGPVVQADMNGVNTQIAGIAAPPTDFVDGQIIGSGNVSFQSVPEPGSLSLLALGLLGFGVMMRRRLRPQA